MHAPPLQYTAPPAIPPAIPESQAVMQDSFKAPPMPQRPSFPAFPRSSRDSGFGFGARSDSTTSRQALLHHWKVCEECFACVEAEEATCHLRNTVATAAPLECLLRSWARRSELAG